MEEEFWLLVCRVLLGEERGRLSDINAYEQVWVRSLSIEDRTKWGLQVLHFASFLNNAYSMMFQRGQVSFFWIIQHIINYDVCVA